MINALEKLGYKKRDGESSWVKDSNNEYYFIRHYDDGTWSKGNLYTHSDFTSDEILAIAEVIKEGKLNVENKELLD